MHRALSERCHVSLAGSQTDGGGRQPHLRSNGTMNNDQDLDRLARGALLYGLSRRRLLRLMVTGAGASALGGLLAACGNAAPAAAPTPPASGQAAPAAAAASQPAAAPTPAPAAAKPAAASGGGSGGQVSIHWTKPVTFNTLYSTAGSEQGVERLMFGALVRVNDKLEAIPDLAEKIDVAPDAKTYTFTLKKGVTFTDGKPLTAQDVRFTFERAVDKRAASYWRGRLLDIQGATEYGDQQA